MEPRTAEFVDLSTRALADAGLHRAIATANQGTGLPGPGGIRAPLHPRLPRSAPSTIGSGRSPRSRALRARRIGALGASPAPGSPVLGLLAAREAAIAAIPEWEALRERAAPIGAAEAGRDGARVESRTGEGS
jgi:hypothetical protein